MRPRKPNDNKGLDPVGLAAGVLAGLVLLYGAFMWWVGTLRP